MNYETTLKCRELPLRPNEKAIALVIATYTGLKTDSCFPSYSTIHKDTQASDATIKDTLDLLSSIGVIEYRNRADVRTGKKNNEYRFIFKGKGIIFYKSKGAYTISKANRDLLKQRVTEARKEIKIARKERSEARKTAPKAVMNTPPVQDYGNSQNLYLNVRDTQGLEGGTNTPPVEANTPPLGGRSINNVETTSHSTNRITDNCLNTKKQKQVRQDDYGNSDSNIQHGSNIITPSKKIPSKQSKDEWLADYNNA